MVEASQGAVGLPNSRWFRAVRHVVLIGFLAAFGFGTVAWSGCGGGNACQACRDDCLKNNIPLPDCNCGNLCN